MQLENAIADIVGVSEGVTAFLNKNPTESKFDVDSGKARIDNSLNPLGGKNPLIDKQNGTKQFDAIRSCG